VERLGDQVLADLGAVGVGRVKQVHTQLDDAPQHALALLRILRRSPDPLAGDAHRAEAEPAYLEVTADREGHR
jgi:hypothetical protein